MIDSLLFTWRENRLKVAIAATVLIFGASLLLSLLNSESFDLPAALIQSSMNLGLYVIMTPVFVIGYHFYQKQQHDKNPSYKSKIIDTSNLDIYLAVYTVYAVLAFTASLLVNNIFH
ncbi:hypothetical protein [Labilibaculum antarcticum]|uniref:Uncharacterized protein n=1 Tax=Labilibaculum antarcticum TaxID=1717717 RepID=A0A1Y1CPV7_9BACT|nr:hypothetical protein [Labilibaculum antarcticum]BAX81982.1 hypothetical protein ALGA_3690 [Labilibaculum antarcticum]